MSRPAEPVPPGIQKQSLEKSTVRCSFLRLKISYV